MTINAWWAAWPTREVAFASTFSPTAWSKSCVSGRRIHDTRRSHGGSAGMTTQTLVLDLEVLICCDLA